MNIIPLIILFCIAFALQYLLTFLQMRSFMGSYRSLRQRGRVAIGKARGAFRAGAIVMERGLSEDAPSGAAYKGCFGSVLQLPGSDVGRRAHGGTGAAYESSQYTEAAAAPCGSRIAASAGGF